MDRADNVVRFGLWRASATFAAIRRSQIEKGGSSACQTRKRGRRKGREPANHLYRYFQTQN
jgi:hypothetical protein